MASEVKTDVVSLPGGVEGADTNLSNLDSGAGANIKTAYEAEADTNAFTDTEQTKLSGIATGATANDTDANLKARANHTGTQTASTISDFDTEVSNNASVTANTAKVTNATHTGDVTGSTALTIANDAVTYAKMQNVSATDRILGRDTAGAGDVEEITPAALRTMINVEDGATADQTNAEIKTAYEANADTNAFTDAEKTNLGNQSGTNTGDEVTATTTTEGIVELATQAEVDTGTDTARSLTPATFAGSSQLSGKASTTLNNLGTVALNADLIGNKADLTFQSADDATADANPTEDVLIKTGDKTAGTGDSGDLILQPGTSAGGAQGEVRVSTSGIRVIESGTANTGYLFQTSAGADINSRGMHFNNTADELIFEGGAGSKTFFINDDGTHVFRKQFFLESGVGTAALPDLQLGSTATTQMGLYKSGANDFSAAVATVQTMQFTSTATNLFVDMDPSGSVALGSSGNKFTNINATTTQTDQVSLLNGTLPVAILNDARTTPSSATAAGFEGLNNFLNLAVFSQNNTAADAQDCGDILLEGGNQTNAGSSGKAGDVKLRGGTNAGSGAIGHIILDSIPVLEAQTVSLTADDQVVTPTKGLLRISSDNATASNRTFTITANSKVGAIIVLQWTNTNAGELLDAGIHKLNGNWTPLEFSTLTLMSDGTNWIEIARSIN